MALVFRLHIEYASENHLVDDTFSTRNPYFSQLSTAVNLVGDVSKQQISLFIVRFCLCQ
jgi:hypothetical protein